MSTLDEQNETDAFLASKQATWASFIKLSTWGSVAVILLLIVLALIFVV